MTIKVYSKPDCVQCTATYKVLDKTGLQYETLDVSSDTTALAAVKAMGYQQVPVIVAGEDHWSGFRPDRLRQLAS